MTAVRLMMPTGHIRQPTRMDALRQELHSRLAEFVGVQDVAVRELPRSRIEGADLIFQAQAGRGQTVVLVKGALSHFAQVVD
jgi:hypothetical protein